MKLLAIVAIAGLSATSCGKVGDAENAVRDTLRDPQSAVFTKVEYGRFFGNGTEAVCGYVNSRNGFGGMSGPKRFAVAMLDEGPRVQAIDFRGQSAQRLCENMKPYW